MKIYPRSVVLAFVIVAALSDCSQLFAAPAENPAVARAIRFVTNVVQFTDLPEADYLNGCNFRLTGVVTLVDTNRDLMVLQDATGAVALNFRLKDQPLQVGQRSTVEGENCHPYFPGFPDFPYRPSERNILSSFEVPIDANEYRLTRIRGYLHPTATGEYSFWIASDNSSELWLSVNADPSRARRIASVPRFDWVNPNEWTRLPSQHSEPVQLKAGEVYYIEALTEQTTGGEHISVAWQGQGLERSVITAPWLTPWGTKDDATNGILRECWTNYAAGDLDGLIGRREFKSELTVEKVRVSSSGPGELPEPLRLVRNQEWPVEYNYRWVAAEGRVKFTGTEGDKAFFELSDGPLPVQVCASHWTPELSERARRTPVRIEGVCEEIYDPKGTLVPGRIWASAENISFLETTTVTNAEGSVNDPPVPLMTTSFPTMRGFFGIHGVVTFNDWVFGNHYVFVQQESTVVQVAPQKRPFKDQLKVGKWVDLGGALEPGQHVPVITPLLVKGLGWHSMPLPVGQPLSLDAPEGRWSELECVVHSISSNGTLSVAGKEGTACLWIGQISTNALSRFVDARLRVRGVLMRSLLDAPILLVPSPDFVDVEKGRPEDPFAAPRRAIADLFPEFQEFSWLHRVRVTGEVTYRDAQSFFVQDASGGVRVRTSDPPTVKVGDAVEVLAFPSTSGFAGTLTEPQVRPATGVGDVTPRDLDLSKAMSSRRNGALTRVSATLLAKKTNAVGQVLELQEQQRVFTATLLSGQGNLPDLTAGSRVRLTGVCDDETIAAPLEGEKAARTQLLYSLNILLRSPQDVMLISGPPWWTWKRTASLVGALLMVLVVTLLWVHLLRRRLERQQAAQLAFSQQVLKRLEDERRRIAVNLHDSLGQILMAIKNHALVAIQRPHDEERLQHRLNEISGATSQAIDEVRQITHGLRPYQLDRLGLTQAIRASIDQAAANNSIVFASRVENVDGLFDQNSEIHVYRIIQEAVTNVVKHSGATEAAVAITRRPGVVLLSIRDNGRGFESAKASSPHNELAYGLSGMAERARILGAVLTIDSRPGGGTSLTVEVPLPVNKE